MKYSTEKIWDDFGGKLRSFIAYRVPDPSYVDDLLQDVFVKIHTNISTLQDDAKIRSWIYQIARNTIIDYFRKYKIKLDDIDTIPIEGEDALMTIDEIEGEDPEKDVVAGLREMIEKLPDKYSQALLLVEFEGLSQIELARQLGISISGAKSRVQRGRQLLKESLMRCCHFELDRYGTIIGISPACCCCCPDETN